MEKNSKKYIYIYLHTYLYTYTHTHTRMYIFLRSLSGEESASQAGDTGSVPGSGRSPGEGNGNALEYSYLRNPRTEAPGGL